MTYESPFAIDQEVRYRLSEHHTPQHGIIVAIRFTKMKVFYDVLSEYYGQVDKNIPSDNVFETNHQVKDVTNDLLHQQRV